MKKITDKKIDEVAVYKEYIKAKGTKGYSVTKLCKKLGIPRPTLYLLIKRFEGGDEIQLNRCLLVGKYDCLWEHRYFRRFSILNEDDKKYAQQIKTLIKDMHGDGFGVRDIARRISKDPSTVMHHLKIKS